MLLQILYICSMDKDKYTKAWYKILDTVMSLPNVEVKRDDFLRDTLSPYCRNQQLQDSINGNPMDVVGIDTILAVARKRIRKHLIAATSTSFLAGIPGGALIAATIPADLLQFYYHALVLSQELAYIYGVQNFYDGKGTLNDDAKKILTVMMGVMAGLPIAYKGLAMMMKAEALHPLAQRIAKMLGADVLKHEGVKSAGKLLPVLGGAVSATLTYQLFKKQARRLNDHLRTGNQLLEDKSEK
jgi:uncharacterized membrane protein